VDKVGLASLSFVGLSVGGDVRAPGVPLLDRDLLDCRRERWGNWEVRQFDQDVTYRL
jgi:hypothetical protein